jgi:hypothetical protein
MPMARFTQAHLELVQAEYEFFVARVARAKKKTS